MSNPCLLWTKSAVDCYHLGCRCSVCEIVPSNFKKYCKMKQVVLSLVKNVGKPVDKI